MNAPAKSIFKSKTALAAGLTALAGTIGSIYPEANQLLATHASSILMLLGALNLVLRLVTRGRVVLFRD